MGLLKQNYDKKYSLKTAKNIHNNPPPPRKHNNPKLYRILKITEYSKGDVYMCRL